MRGDEWNRLVAVPTGTEVEAALAEVRVRAVPIARRNARNQRALRFVALALVGIGGVVAGRATAGSALPGTQVSGDWRLTVVPAGYEAVPGPVERWHITKWDNENGYRIGMGEAWIEGPANTRFQISGYSSFGGWFFTVTPNHERDATQLWLHGTLKSVPVPADRFWQLHQWRSISTRLELRQGQSAVFYPFGESGATRTVIRIDGPYAPRPSDVPWREPDRISLLYEAGQPVLACSNAPREVRYVVTNVGALSIRPQ
jgi:hypothetical protein